MRSIIALLLILLSGASAAAGPFAQDEEPVCPEPLAIAAGAAVTVRSGVYLRAEPTQNAAIVNYYDEFTLVTIDDGPVCAENLIWWRVRGVGEPGWVVQQIPDLQVVFPGPPDPAQFCPTPLNLVPGSRLPIVRGGVRIRTEPTTEARVITVALVNTEVTVIDGPECNEQLNWWLVQAPVDDYIIEGWMAEGFENTPFVGVPPERSLAAGTLCAPPRNLPPGTEAFVDYRGQSPKTLRAGPGLDAIPLYTLIEGVGLLITGEPVCADNLNWFPVQILSRPDVTGWLAEGGPGDYWIERIAVEPLR